MKQSPGRQEVRLNPAGRRVPSARSPFAVPRSPDVKQSPGWLEVTLSPAGRRVPSARSPFAGCEADPRQAGGDAEPQQAGGEAEPGRQTCVLHAALD